MSRRITTTTIKRSRTIFYCLRSVDGSPGHLHLVQASDIGSRANAGQLTTGRVS